MIALSLLLDARATEAPVFVDVEIDPVNYVLGGASLSAGVQVGRVRGGLGSWFLEVPPAFHGAPGLDLHEAGSTLRAEVSLGPRRRGAYVGAIGQLVSARLVDHGSGLTDRIATGMAGVEGGVRVRLPAGFYVNPWLALGARLGPGRLAAGDATYELPWYVALPIVHLGWHAPVNEPGAAR